MADLNIMCEKCGSMTTVSEFVDFNALKCAQCGEKIVRPQTAAAKTTRTVSKTTAQVSEEDNRVATASVEPSLINTKKKAPKKKVHMTHYILSWAVLILLGFVMYMLRYGSTLPGDVLKSFKVVAPIVFFTVHVLIILTAFRDSVFQGILCILVPLYTFFYLFGISDSFYLRAVVAALLVGIGEDSFHFYKKAIMEGYSSSQHWVGGGALEWRDTDEKPKR